MPLATYRGHCHCGAVRFEADADLNAGTVRCNCSICTRSRFWLVFVPAERFRLLAGEEKLSDYRFGAQRIRHRFCSVCGVKPFGMASDGSGVAISVNCLDELTPERLAALPVTYVDGAHDRWDAAPAVTSYL
ncbi:MAG: aldehyde-activating protein [Caldimonas sp.]|uniref:GFA family protein n=1 Tax=Caldimonas manganoxidans TaxID=196015 RepID=UPI0003767791|nr:GFA family protein [Caldimonas manganoxidans]GIX23851.1 MAG: aldehyde-activating protein [Caldimonas sp.]